MALAIATPPPLFFDDFAYTKPVELAASGWVVGTKTGWPGIRGARWSGVSVGNGLLRLTATTDGTPAGTVQAQVCHRRKYREGTYAARIRFGAGAGSDQIVESFYAISRFRRGMDPDYSETDFEYLPNGGWGATAPMLYATTWETFNPVPRWIAVNDHSARAGRLDGWHVLVLQVDGGRVTYSLDGAHVGTHGGRYYPEVPMSINFNVWFVNGGLLRARSLRRYAEHVDWVYHRAGAVLSPQQVTADVARLRAHRVAFTDTVQATGLATSCDL